MFVCIVEDMDLAIGQMTVKIVTSFANLSPLSVREFVYFVECHGESIKRGREYLVMADWKVEGRRGRLEMVFIRRWGKRGMERLERWKKGEDKCQRF